MRSAILAYDLAQAKRACIATVNAVTAAPCPHGYTWQCPEVRERYVFVTTDKIAATAMGEAVPE